MDNRLESLERLARLRESGLLTPEELEAEKRRILDGDKGGVPTAPGDVTGASPERISFTTRYHGFRQAVRRRPWVLGAVGGGAVLTAFLVAIILTGPSPETAPDRPVPKKSQREGSPSLANSGFVPFDDVLAGHVANCSFAETVVAGFTSLDRSPAEASTDVPFRLPDFEAPLQLRRATLSGGENGGEARLLEAATRGRWRGLRVTRLRVVTWGSGGPVSLQVRFMEAPGQVATSLNAAGFSLAPAGQVKHVENGRQNYAVALEPIGEGTALTCARMGARQS